MNKSFQMSTMGLALGLMSSPAFADVALDQSCRLLSVLGANQGESIGAVVADFAARWPEENRVAATEQLVRLLDTVEFAGGNVYQLARLGDDLVEHLVVLRLAAGETLGIRLTYEWIPEGMTLSRLDLKLQYTTELGIQLPTAAAPETCP